jgi:uncharacterized protein
LVRKSHDVVRSACDHFSLEETMKLFGLVATIVLSLASLARAEDALPAKVVRVAAMSEVKVVPDRAVIQVGVEKQDSSATVAKHAEDAAARRIFAALHKEGIDDKDVQTTFLSLQPQVTTRKKVQITYFVATQTMTVIVRDLSKLDALLESLIKAGGNRIDSITYETSNLRKYRDQARDLAVRAAREKAQALAQALGQDIGKARAIEEMADFSLPSGFFANANAVSYEFNIGKSGPATAVGQNSISATVVVSFDLN